MNIPVISGFPFGGVEAALLLAASPTMYNIYLNMTFTGYLCLEGAWVMVFLPPL